MCTIKFLLLKKNHRRQIFSVKMQDLKKLKYSFVAFLNLCISINLFKS